MFLAKGVDLSEMNGSVDFKRLQAAGVKFVILRSGYGSDYSNQQDAEFENNIRKAEAAGMPWGVYHYSYAKNAAGGQSEAAHALRLIGERKPAYGVWYDMEDNTTLGGDLAGAAEAFCSTVKQAGLYCGVYANLNWWENHLTSPVFDKYDRWCAQYNSVCELTRPYGIWQFTDAWKIGGKNFDGNYAYRDYPALTGRDGEASTDEYSRWQAHFRQYERELAKKPVSGWAKDSVEHCKQNGIMNGDKNGEFRPQSFVTREELAAVADAILTAARNR